MDEGEEKTERAKTGRERGQSAPSVSLPEGTLAHLISAAWGMYSERGPLEREKAPVAMAKGGDDVGRGREGCEIPHCYVWKYIRSSSVVCDERMREEMKWGGGSTGRRGSWREGCAPHCECCRCEEGAGGAEEVAREERRKRAKRDSDVLPSRRWKQVVSSNQQGRTAGVSGSRLTATTGAAETPAEQRNVTALEKGSEIWFDLLVGYQLPSRPVSATQKSIEELDVGDGSVRVLMMITSEKDRLVFFLLPHYHSTRNANLTED